MQLQAITHPPFFDECLHLRNIWQISEGKIPHSDFWCFYPTLGYYLTLPLFRAFPETPYILLPLRFFAIIIFLVMGGLFAFHGYRIVKQWFWGIAAFALIIMTPKLGDFFAEYSIDHLSALLAVGALVLMFSSPSIRKLFMVCILSILSVLITAKYAAPLLGAFIAYCLYSGWYLRCPGKVISIIGFGVFITLGVLWFVYPQEGIFIWQDMIWSNLFMLQWTATLENSPFHLWQTIILFLIKHWIIALLILGGIIGWLFNGIRSGKASIWTGTGVLAGIFLSAITLRKYHEQYLTPLMVCLCLFVPYLFLLIRRFRWKSLITTVLLLVTIRAGVNQASMDANRLVRYTHRPINPMTESTRGMGENIEPGLFALWRMQELLKLIPEGEKVVGMWKFHPIFRFDQTFVTSDVGNEESYKHIIDPSNKVYKYFQPKYFAEELEKNPPAYICLVHLSNNYPPDWLGVCIEFLKQHKDLYQQVDLGGAPCFLRRDLHKQE